MRIRRAKRKQTRHGGFYRLVHKLQHPDITVPGASDISFSGTQAAGSSPFTLSEIPNIASYEALFTHYRISGIRVDYIPREPVNTTAYNSTTEEHSSPMDILTVIEPTQFSSVTTTTPTYSNLLNWGNVRIRTFNRRQSVFFRPYVSLDALEQGSSTVIASAFSLKRSPWIDLFNGNGQVVAGSSIEHLGLMTGFNNPGSLDSLVGVYVTYYVQFKGRRI